MLTGTETYVTSGDLRLWTESFGAATDPAVLLIMGTATQAVGWPDPLVSRLVRGELRIIRYDHRDTGRSDVVDFASAPYTLDDLARDALAVLDGHGVDAAHLVGASLGGTITQWLAVHRPDRVRAVSAIMTSPMGNNPAPAWARALSGAPADPAELPAPDPAFLRDLLGPAGEGDQVERDLATQRALHGRALPFDEAAARSYIALSHARARDADAARQHDLAGRVMTDARRASLAGITAPALVIHGSADPLFPVAHGRALRDAIPGARLAVVEGMGHGFFAPGLPERVAELVLEHERRTD